VIERQVHHLVRLVDDLLDVSRFTRGRIELKKEPVELSLMVARAIETVSPLLEQRSHRLEVAVPSGLTVDGDAGRLQQLLVNLLTNAAKYTDPRGTITVSASAESGQAVLSVKDTGIGIAVELVPKLFDLFVQGERALDRAQGGLGLGLTIVKSLVELHGGSIQAKSDGAGKGSEFVVRLPLAEHTPPPAIEREPREDPAHERSLRVLVVDDNTDAADLLAEFLRQHGHQTAVAHNGPRALEQAEAFRPEIAVLDIGLPVMDGYELARRLRSVEGLDQIRLIALTGYGQPQDRALALAAGFDHHLVKPFDPEQLAPLLS
jgi:CheY-like chemotaxis protein/anti-sigma regulatory factor (Ser/Thr protein kinase)